jgi:hypothetical protein
MKFPLHCVLVYSWHVFDSGGLIHFCHRSVPISEKEKDRLSSIFTKITSVHKHISFTSEIDRVLVMQNIMDISHKLLIIEIENPRPKICLLHSEEYETDFVIEVKDNYCERKCGIWAPAPCEHNETNNSE